jgi:N-formylmaleamate deformylase
MTNWMTGVCEASGVEIHYLRTGGSKPPLILLHGLSASAVCWSPLARAGLAKPFLLGHSMGGMTAAVVASAAASAIRGVILADPTFLSPQRQCEVHESDVVEQHRRLLNSNESDVLAQLRMRHPHRSSEIVELLAVARHQTRIDAFDVLTPPTLSIRVLTSPMTIV